MSDTDVHGLMAAATAALRSAAPGEYAAIVVALASSKARILHFDAEGEPLRYSDLDVIPRPLGDAVSAFATEAIAKAKLGDQARKITFLLETGRGELTVRVEPLRGLARLTVHGLSKVPIEIATVRFPPGDVH